MNQALAHCLLRISNIFENACELSGPCMYRYSGKLGLVQRAGGVSSVHPQEVLGGRFQGGEESRE